MAAATNFENFLSGMHACRGDDADPGADPDLSSYTLVKLRELCKASGLPTSGKKADLVAALTAHRKR